MRELLEDEGNEKKGATKGQEVPEHHIIASMRSILAQAAQVESSNCQINVTKDDNQTPGKAKRNVARDSPVDSDGAGNEFNESDLQRNSRNSAEVISECSPSRSFNAEIVSSLSL